MRLVSLVTQGPVQSTCPILSSPQTMAVYGLTNSSTNFVVYTRLHLNCIQKTTENWENKIHK